jgi:hypothetical protein
MIVFGYFFVIAYTIVRVVLGAILWILKGIIYLLGAIFKH